MSDLYLVTPAVSDAQAFLPVLEAGLAHHQPAALLLRLADMPASTARQAVLLLKPVIQARDIALMLENAPTLAQETGCDGVHLSASYTAASVKDVRRIIGPDLQLGVAVGESRDAAMCAGEDGADYICFGAEDGASLETVSALTRWWSLMMELPVVAQAQTPADLAVLNASGADFVMPSEQWWRQPDAWQG